MGSRPNWSEIERELRAAERAAEQQRRAQCAAVVKRWNEMVKGLRNPGHWPSIGVAVTAGFPFLDVLCPGCQQVKQIDLRTLDRHRETRLDALIPALSCRSCQPHPPFARIRALSEQAWVSPNAPVSMPSRRT
jgi:hypothetical protein